MAVGPLILPYCLFFHMKSEFFMPRGASPIKWFHLFPTSMFDNFRLRNTGAGLCRGGMMDGREVKTLRYAFQNNFFLNQEISRWPNDPWTPLDEMGIWLRPGRNTLNSIGK